MSPKISASPKAGPALEISLHVTTATAFLESTCVTETTTVSTIPTSLQRDNAVSVERFFFPVCIRTLIDYFYAFQTNVDATQRRSSSAPRIRSGVELCAFLESGCVTETPTALTERTKTLLLLAPTARNP